MPPKAAGGTELVRLCEEGRGCLVTLPQHPRELTWSVLIVRTAVSQWVRVPENTDGMWLGHPFLSPRPCQSPGITATLASTARLGAQSSSGADAETTTCCAPPACTHTPCAHTHTMYTHAHHVHTHHVHTHHVHIHTMYTHTVYTDTPCTHTSCTHTPCTHTMYTHMMYTHTHPCTHILCTYTPHTHTPCIHIPCTYTVYTHINTPMLHGWPVRQSPGSGDPAPEQVLKNRWVSFPSACQAGSSLPSLQYFCTSKSRTG